MPGEERNGSTGVRAAPGADLSRREGIAGAIQQPGDDSPQSGRVHNELYLYFSERRPRKTAEQHDRQPWARETHLEGPRGESRAVRSPLRAEQGVTGREHARAE